MPTWSTDALPVHERFDCWREVRARHLFGVTAELPAYQRAGFSARMATRTVGSATLVEMQASPYSVERSAWDIQRAPGGSLCLYQQVGGGAWFGTGAMDFVLGPGALATSHTDLAYATRPTGTEGFNLRILKLPAEAAAPSTVPLHDLAPRPLEADERLALCLGASLSALAATSSAEAGPGDHDRIGAIAQLILLARRAVPAGSVESRRAVRSALLDAARQVLDARFRQRALAPEAVAAHLGVSVRQLHMLFEPTGSTFHRTLNGLRVAEARRRLVEEPDGAIAEIAFAAGFDSLPTFYRVFRALDGHTPGDYRR
ncbi:MAG: AraC family transcriptional regulator [Proteobacteria bacterium]|nr:AraC family transcriptional regulator [Pseudomonadota bacterium]